MGELKDGFCLAVASSRSLLCNAIHRYNPAQHVHANQYQAHTTLKVKILKAPSSFFRTCTDWVEVSVRIRHQAEEVYNSTGAIVF
jgi:hypothetical protein